jgi:hypothetical protein
LWVTGPEYVRWYFKVSHLYMIPLLPGDSPKPAELEVLVEEKAEREGGRYADPVLANSELGLTTCVFINIEKWGFIGRFLCQDYCAICMYVCIYLCI